MDLNTISEKINELLKFPSNQQFDMTDTIYSNNFPVNYGIVKGNNTIVVYKSGLNGSYIGWEQKYLKIARLLNSEFGCSVISVSNPAEAERSINIEMEIVKKYVKKSNFYDYKIYYMGYSNSAVMGFYEAQNYKYIDKLLLINLPLNPSVEEMSSFYADFKGNSVDFVYGEKDNCYKVGKLYSSFENERIHFNFLKDVDHDFTDNVNLFISLPYYFFFNRKELENLAIGENKNNSFDSQKWVTLYNDIINRVKKGNFSARDELREILVDLFYQTIEITQNGSYVSENGSKINIEGNNELRENSKFFYKEFNVNDLPCICKKTEFVVENLDSFEASKKLSEEGFNPIVLNMANRQRPGGGVLTGSNAQEETLVRRSNLFLSLFQYYNKYADKFGIPRSKFQYPMDRDFGGIYSPNITVFRSERKFGFAFLDKPFKTSVVSVAAINRPTLDNDRLTESTIIGTKNKIRTILRIGLINGHDAIVLGAFGCGAFRNPPSHMAELFEEVINEPEFKNKYKKISFAILEDHNSRKEHNKDGNFKPFFERFIGSNNF